MIGTVDTGISPGNRSFAATGDDGYTVTNPLGDGNYLGACDPDNADQYDPQFPCNSKLIRRPWATHHPLPRQEPGRSWLRSAGNPVRHPAHVYHMTAIAHPGAVAA